MRHGAQGHKKQNPHEGHKLISINDEESLKNKEFTFDLTLKDFNEKCIKNAF